ncbi:hypothetical protein CEXT_694621, partial [Caerostris extrusa]
LPSKVFPSYLSSDFLSWTSQTGPHQVHEGCSSQWLSGGTQNLEDMQNDEHISDLTDEQLLYVKRHMAGEEKAPTVQPFIRTVTTVGWNFIKKIMGY